MTMASLTKPSLISLIIILILAHHSTQFSTHIMSFHEILPLFGLPSGLLPDSISTFTFTPESGDFVVELKEQPCYVHLDDYLLSYDKLVTGTLKIGSITNLKGLRIKWHLLWLKVHEILVDLPPNDNIYFQFGLFNNVLDVHQFLAVPSCSPQKKWISNDKQLQPQLSDVIE